MRRILLLSVLFPASALADQIPATSRITEVTIFAQGARVVREVTFDAPAGAHDLVLADLPAALGDGSTLRIAPGPGVAVGAWSVTADGIPVAEPRQSAAQMAAEDRVRTLEDDERRALSVIDDINGRIEAAEAMAGFLRQIGTGEAGIGATTPMALKEMADMVGAQTAEATAIRAAALFERRRAEAALAEVQADLLAAREALAALDDGNDDSSAALHLGLSTANGGPGVLRLSYHLDGATWTPVYDIDLARKDGRVRIDRGVTVAQDTGEDWTGVNLTLSTARLGEQTAASYLPRDLRRIEPEVEMDARSASSDMMAGAAAPEAMVEPAVVAEKAAAMGMDFVGDTVVYRYGLPVTIASGVQSLRLALDTIDLAPKVRAMAVPRHDGTAYLEATVTNTTPEILLPGDAMLSRDGALIGSTYLDAIAPGVEFTLSFGPVEGIRLSRTEPIRAEGATGILSSTNQIEESATIRVENVSDEAWDVRVLDSVPYSEQEDLQITYRADPEPDETRVGDVRGHLAWNLTLAPGEMREIKIEQSLNWPEGMVLR
jgi:uncharacterized protein (TIGR02231 family)